MFRLWDGSNLIKYWEFYYCANPKVYDCDNIQSESKSNHLTPLRHGNIDISKEENQIFLLVKNRNHDNDWPLLTWLADIVAKIQHDPCSFA